MASENILLAFFALGRTLMNIFPGKNSPKYFRDDLDHGGPTVQFSLVNK